MTDLKILKDKVVIITGSGRGIGRATAELCSSLGAKVVINDVDAEPAVETTESIREKGGEVACFVGDVSDNDGAKSIIDLAFNAFGKISALVNNAGITGDSLLVRMTEEQWDDIMRVHLKSAFLCSKYFVQQVMKQGVDGGTAIINITSPVALRGNIGQANYTTAKAGILGFTRTLSKELERYKIRVNAVAPVAWTRLTQAIPEEVIKKRGETFEKKIKGAKPEFVANIISFLISDEAEEINCQVFGVFGDEFQIWSHPRIAFRKQKENGFSVYDYVSLKNEIVANLQKTEDSY